MDYSQGGQCVDVVCNNVGISLMAFPVLIQICIYYLFVKCYILSTYVIMKRPDNQEAVSSGNT